MTICHVIDYETTGTPDDEAAEIIEIGRVAVRADDVPHIIEAWSTLVQPRGEIPPVTMAVHHITPTDVQWSPELREVWDDFTGKIDAGDVLVAHNAKFERHFWDGGDRRWIDTYKVARVVWPDAPGHGNQALRYWLNLPADRMLASPPHRALPDAYVTALLLIRLLQEKTIDQMVHISEYPALLKVMNFGKHRGMTFEDAPSDYLEWIVEKSEMDEDTKFSARYWLKKRGR